MEGILPLKAQQEMQTSNLSFITKERKFSNVESESEQIDQMDGIVTNGAANDADSSAIITTCKWMQVDHEHYEDATGPFRSRWKQ
ncbi:uncharacterized protein LOC144626395 isoform X1 [Crassostrea virginica]